MHAIPMDDLIAKIEQAFAGVAHPGDERLTDSTYGEEPAALEAAFRGKTDWQKLDASVFRPPARSWSATLSNSSLPFSSPWSSRRPPLIREATAMARTAVAIDSLRPSGRT